MLVLLILATVQFSSCDFGSEKDVIGEDVIELEEIKDKMSELNDRLKENPNDAQAYYERSSLFEINARFEPAMADIQRALTLEPSESAYFSRLGRLKFKTGDMSGAKRELEKSLTLNPENTEGLLLLGELHFVLRDYDKSMVKINEALRIDDQLKKGYFIKGMMYKELGDTTKAISSLRTVSELDPDDTETFLILGLLHAAQNNPLALDYYNSAIDLNPSSVEAHYNKGVFLQTQKKAREAIAEYRAILEIDPSNEVAYHNIGYVQMTQLDELDSAILAFTKSIESNSSYFQAHYNRGYAHELKGKLKLAQIDYRETLKLSPDNNLAIEGLNRLD